MGSHAPALPAAKTGRRSVRKRPTHSASNPLRDDLRSALSIAEEKGLLKGRRTLVIRGRMPEELVAEAKRKTGISSDSKLLEAALANLVVADDYAEWLFSQRCTVDPALDLEF
jgi:hypothetical protein